jgi:hypothetical protein
MVWLSLPFGLIAVFYALKSAGLGVFSALKSGLGVASDNSCTYIPLNLNHNLLFRPKTITKLQIISMPP